MNSRGIRATLLRFIMMALHIGVGHGGADGACSVALSLMEEIPV
jgi:hypothetical protein